jgi:hypothetical protein
MGYPLLSHEMPTGRMMHLSAREAFGFACRKCRYEITAQRITEIIDPAGHAKIIDKAGNAVIVCKYSHQPTFQAEPS